MSMVVFPFRTEDPATIARNLAAAANHPRVTRVVAVGATKGPLLDAVASTARSISHDTGVPVQAVAQRRVGNRRPGKGDGMNTGLHLFLAGSEPRLHFYDADITNFDASWIEGAEAAAERGFGVVRHFFPRASTDAMVTWMVTRPGLALVDPSSRAWRINQPLGGELLLTREVARALADDAFVAARSDWGIDTVITHATVTAGADVYEHFVPDGKQHALYGSLEELRPMVVECFEAVRDLRGRPGDPGGRLETDPPRPATAPIAHAVGYDVESTLRLLTAPWSPEEVSAAAELPEPVGGPMLENVARPTFRFLTTDRWGDAVAALLDRYRPEPGWQALLFRLWVARVLAYTTSDALAGHTRAMEMLSEAVEGYARRGSSGDRQESDGPHPRHEPRDLA